MTKVARYILLTLSIILCASCIEEYEGYKETQSSQGPLTGLSSTAIVLQYLTPQEDQSTIPFESEASKIRIVNSSTKDIYYEGPASDSICFRNAGTPVSVDILDATTNEVLKTKVYIPFTGVQLKSTEKNILYITIPTSTTNIYYVTVPGINEKTDIEVRIGNPFPYIRIATPLLGGEKFSISLQKFLENRLCTADRLRIVTNGDETVIYPDDIENSQAIEGIKVSMDEENEYSFNITNIEEGLYQLKAEIGGFRPSDAQKVIDLINNPDNYIHN